MKSCNGLVASKHVSQFLVVMALFACSHLCAQVVPFRDQVRQITGDLASKNRGTRLQALEEAADLGPAAKETLSALVECLGDQDEQIREHAANAIVELGPMTIPSLVDMLGKNNIPKCSAACSALQQFGPLARQALPALRVLLKSPHPELRGAAALTLACIEGNSSSELMTELLRLEKAATAQEGILRALQKVKTFSPRCAIVVANCMKRAAAKEEYELADLAGFVLSSMGESAVEPLRSVLREAPRDSLLFAFTLEASRRMTGQKGVSLKALVPDLMAILKSRRPEDRFDVLPVLEAMGKDAQEALPELRRIVRSTKGVEKISMAKVLYAISKDDEDAKIILSGLKDPDVAVRGQAAFVLSQNPIETREAITALTEALQDGEVRRVSICALRALGYKARDALPALRRAMKDQNGEIQQAIKVIETAESPEAAKNRVARLTKLLETTQGPEQIEIARSLGGYESCAEEAIPGLLRLVKTLPATGDRIVIAEAIYRINSSEPESLNILVQGLRSPDSSIRKAAIDAVFVNRITPPEVIQAVTETLIDSKTVQLYALSYLSRVGKRGKQAVPLLEKLLEHEDQPIRLGARFALKTILLDEPAQPAAKN